jgi:hypothetical protein
MNLKTECIEEDPNQEIPENETTTSAGKDLISSEHRTLPSLSLKTTFDPYAALKVGSGTTLYQSPTRVGKLVNYLKGIDDFGKSRTVEGSGASINKKLPPTAKLT